MTAFGDTVLKLRELRELMFSSASGAVASPLHEQPYLLLGLDDGADAAVSGVDQAELAAWLGTQPCPVIGLVGTGEASVLREACDLVLDDVADLNTVLANIRRAPLAAMTLVQLLRVTGSLPLAWTSGAATQLAVPPTWGGQ